jgi:hypothetical protein
MIPLLRAFVLGTLCAIVGDRRGIVEDMHRLQIHEAVAVAVDTEGVGRKTRVRERGPKRRMVMISPTKRFDGWRETHAAETENGEYDNSGGIN